jgi:hypothetical protein
MSQRMKSFDSPNDFIITPDITTSLDAGAINPRRSRPAPVGGDALTHHASSHRVQINITQPIMGKVRYIYPCRYGSGVVSAIADGRPIPLQGSDVPLPLEQDRLK